MASAQHFFFIIFEVIDRAANNIDVIKNKLGEMSKYVSEINNRMNYFNGQAMGIMFTGMAMQRAFGGAFRELFNTFNKVDNNTSLFAKSTQALTASWEFLKFSIVNALNSPAIIEFVFKLVDIINGMSQWTTKNEETVQGLLAIAGVIFGAGGLMYGIGQIALGWGSVFGSQGSIVQDLGARQKDIDAWKGGVGGAILFSIGFFKALNDEKVGVSDLLQDALISLGVAMMTKSPVAGAIAFSLLFVVRIYKDPEGVGESLGFIASQIVIFTHWLWESLGKIFHNIWESLGKVAGNAFISALVSILASNPLTAFLSRGLIKRTFKESVGDWGNITEGVSLGNMGTGFEKGWVSGLLPEFQSGKIGFSPLFTREMLDNYYSLTETENQRIARQEKMVDLVVKEYEVRKKINEELSTSPIDKILGTNDRYSFSVA